MAVDIANDEPLLERLRILVSDPTTDNHVKRKAVELFSSWSLNFRNESGMERLTGLKSQLPTKVLAVRARLINRDVPPQPSVPLLQTTNLPVLPVHVLVLLPLQRNRRDHHNNQTRPVMRTKNPNQKRSIDRARLSSL